MLYEKVDSGIEPPASDVMTYAFTNSATAGSLGVKLWLYLSSTNRRIRLRCAACARKEWRYSGAVHYGSNDKKRRTTTDRRACSGGLIIGPTWAQAQGTDVAGGTRPKCATFFRLLRNFFFEILRPKRVLPRGSKKLIRHCERELLWSFMGR